jgi:hypothetical protein
MVRLQLVAFGPVPVVFLVAPTGPANTRQDLKTAWLHVLSVSSSASDIAPQGPDGMPDFKKFDVTHQ